MAPRREATDSALEVAREALAVAEASLPQYWHRNSRKTYTLWQFFAILMVRRFLRLDLRRTEQLVKDWSDLREAIKLTGVPDHTTLCRAEHRLLKKGALTGSRKRLCGERIAAA